MTPILFYGVPEGCSFGSIVALEWSGLDYRLCRIPMPDVVSSDAYRSLVNPMAETPSFLTGRGEVISESMAILNHIGAEALGSGLAFPQGSSGFDRLNAALAFLNTTFFDAFTPLWHVIEHEVTGRDREALIAYGRSKVARAHALLERRLDGRPWMLGEERSLADAYFTGISRWTEVHQALDRRDYPSVAALHDRLQQDPAVRFAMAIEHEEPANSAGGLRGRVTLEEVAGLVRQAA